jgi:hypothetical protein
MLLGFLCFMSAVVVMARGRISAVSTARLLSAADIVAGTICAAAMGTLLFYLVAPGYLDHVEPLVAATSWMYLRGEPIYPDWLHDPSFYGDNKGPALYLINSAILRLLPTIWASKLAGFAAGLAGAAFQYATWLWLRLSKPTALRLTVLAFLISSIEFYTFSNRADSFIYCLVSSSLLLTMLLELRAAAAAIGLLAGFATAMKLDGVFYFIPAMTWLLSSETGRRKFEGAALFAACAIGGFLLPFVMMAESISGFVSYIASSAHHGLSFDLLCGNALFALSLMTIASLGYLLTSEPLDRHAKLYLGSLSVCLILVVVGAAKPGAGMHHLYPFTPCAVFAFSRFLTFTSRETRGVAARRALPLLYFAVVASFGAGTAFLTFQLARGTFNAIDRGSERQADLAELQGRYPGAEMGVSDMAHYGETFLYPDLVFRGGRPSLVSATWMDLAYAGVNEGYVMAVLDECRVPAWLLPHGAPFSLTSYYTSKPLYSSAFRARFFAGYRLAEQGQHYDVWTCRRVILPGASSD